MTDIQNYFKQPFTNHFDGEILKIRPLDTESTQITFAEIDQKYTASASLVLIKTATKPKLPNTKRNLMNW